MLFLLLLTSTILTSDENIYNNCLKFNDIIKEATYNILGNNFPYYYNIGLIFTESNCRWVIGKDKYGSIGYAQIVPVVWDRYLLRYFPEYKVKDHPHHFYAFIYILKTFKDKVDRDKYCKEKLWTLYQSYNGGFLVLKECNKAKLCEWNECRKFCNRNIGCIYFDKKTGKCKQYKDLCEVNYQYSKKICFHGEKIKQILNIQEENEISFW